MITVAELRRKGVKVRVKHHRQYFVGIPVEKHGMTFVDNILTRFEFENAERVVPVTDFVPEQTTYSECVCTHGGFTEVEVTTPKGMTVRGKYNFNNKQFSRKEGLDIALNRALVELVTK